MNGKEELHSKITEKQKRIDELINKFVLTPELNDLFKEIAVLRVECGASGHEFEDGSCKWCGKPEEEEK